MVIQVYLHPHDGFGGSLVDRDIVSLRARLRGCEERRPGDEGTRWREGPHAVGFRNSQKRQEKVRRFIRVVVEPGRAGEDGVQVDRQPNFYLFSLFDLRRMFRFIYYECSWLCYVLT